MKNKITLWVLLAVMVLVGVIFVYRFMTPLKPGQVVKSILPLLKKAEPSPYSLGWGSELLRVVDQNGEGVADATVSFTKYLRRDCDGNTTEEPPEWQGTTVTTNERGEFSPPPEIWQMEEGEKKPSIRAKIEVAGFLPRSDVGVGVNYGNDTGEIDLFRIGRIEGAIIDPNGQPIANAPIWLNPHTYYKNPGVSCGGCYSATAKTDESGGFVFDKVPPGLHVVKFPGHTGGCGPEPKIEKIPFKEYVTFQMIDMKDGVVKSDVFLDLRQSRGTIAGKVVDKYNRPMAGASAILFRVVKRYFADGSGWSSSTENLKSVSADENGDYVLDHIPEGDYQLQAQYAYEKGKSYKSGDPLNIYLAGNQKIVFNLVLERQDDSLPKPGNREKSLFEVPLPEDLGPREMMIVDQKGNGISGASIVFANVIKIRDPKTRRETKEDWSGATLTTDQNGRFMLPEKIETAGKRGGSCTMTIQADGFEKRWHVGTGFYRVNGDPRIDLLKVASVRGRILGKNGQPTKATVRVHNSMTAHINPRTSSSWGGGNSVTTSQDGLFEFKGLQDGVHVIHYSHQSPEKTPITGALVLCMQDGRDVEGLTIDLRQATCEIQGRVLDSNGKPVSKAKVQLLKEIKIDRGGSSVKSWPVFAESERTGRKGQYSIENIRPGVYEIEAVLEGKKRRTSEKMTIAIAEGQTIELDVRLKR